MNFKDTLTTVLKCNLLTVVPNSHYIYYSHYISISTLKYIVLTFARIAYATHGLENQQAC